jgi:hypothetical protein
VGGFVFAWLCYVVLCENFAEVGLPDEQRIDAFGRGLVPQETQPELSPWTFCTFAREFSPYGRVRFLGRL